MSRYLLPLGVFLVMAAFLGIGLTLNPRDPGTVILGKPAPAFTQPQLHGPEKTFSPSDMKGQVWLLNVWGSWCVSCRAEHPYLMELAAQGEVPLVGLNWKDPRDNAIGWLRQWGNPYTFSAVDPDNRVGIDYGVFGAPETFLIDHNGIIREKQVGPFTRESLFNDFMPKVRQLQAEARAAAAAGGGS